MGREAAGARGWTGPQAEQVCSAARPREAGGAVLASLCSGPGARQRFALFACAFNCFYGAASLEVLEWRKIWVETLALPLPSV